MTRTAAAPTAPASLAPILLLSFPPKPQILKKNLSTKPSESRLPITLSRRHAGLVSFFALVSSLSHPSPATAFSIGISGPKDWLKDQKRKTAKFLLAPIDASREILQSAYLLLTASESNYTNKDLEEIQVMLRSASRDCVPQERNSFVAFQANTGVEVCTFRLILKNAASFLDEKDPVKLEAEAMLNDLIKSFTSLNGVANKTDTQPVAKRQKIADALMDTVASLNKFERGVKDCLEI